MTENNYSSSWGTHALDALTAWTGLIMKVVRVTEHFLKELITERNTEKQTRFYLKKEDRRIRKRCSQEIKADAKAQR